MTESVLLEGTYQAYPVCVPPKVCVPLAGVAHPVGGQPRGEKEDLEVWSGKRPSRTDMGYSQYIIFGAGVQ